MWLAVLGMTDQAVHGHADPEVYASSYEDMVALVRRADNYDQQTQVVHEDGSVTKVRERGRDARLGACAASWVPCGRGLGR